LWHDQGMSGPSYGELVPVPRVAIRLPLELPLPAGFAPDRPDTWPVVDGEIEFVGGKLVYMPPSADRQQDTCTDVINALANWRKTHREFVVAGNEAGMILGGEVRGADAAVWRKKDAGGHTGKFRRVPPVLAVEVKGELEEEEALQSKAAWYLAHGVEVVWLLFPAKRQIVVVTSSGEIERGLGERVPTHASLPGLEPAVDELFEQISEDRAE
jgi:Uma2 family endonuclease